MAMALGWVVNVPIALRSLAADFYDNSESESSLSFDMDFLLMLDSAPENGSPGELIDLYYIHAMVESEWVAGQTYSHERQQHWQMS